MPYTFLPFNSPYIVRSNFIESIDVRLNALFIHLRDLSGEALKAENIVRTVATEEQNPMIDNGPFQMPNRLELDFVSVANIGRRDVATKFESRFVVMGGGRTSEGISGLLPLEI
jgi:hypothetical protein